MSSSPSTADSTPNVGVLMYVAARSLEERAYNVMVAAGATDLTPTQARLLSNIDPEGSRAGRLAARARITKQTATFLIGQLERAGYVERVADSRDRRAKVVRLTSRARTIGDAGDAEVARALTEWADHLGPSRMKQLRETMALLREITDPWA